MKRFERYNRIFLDSSPFIYFIEENPRYISIVERIFSMISDGEIKGVSSSLALLEVLVKPIQVGQHDIARQYKELMLSNDNLYLYPLDDRVAEKAAELRARYHGNGFKLNTPDAIQIATGILNGAQAFITNDRNLKHLKEMDIIVLDELISKEQNH